MGQACPEWAHNKPYGAFSDLGRNYSTGGLSSPCEKRDENEALTLAPSPNKNQQPHPQDQAVKNETENCEISFVQEGNEVNVASSTLQGTSNQTESTSTHQTKQATPSVSLQGDYHEQEEKEDKKVYAKEKPVVSVTSSRKLDLQAMKKTKTKSDAYAYTVIDDDCPDPPIWLTIHNSSPDDPDSKLMLYRESKNSILDKTYWLHDSEIQAGQILLKTAFPFLDGLIDPAVTGTLVLPATSEFVQIINVGSHWVCLSTISCFPGVVKVFDSLYRKPNAIAIDHVCRMLLHRGNEVTFVYEKVQKQLGSSACGPFALAFATDLCHGLDPTKQSYDQGLMQQHYVNCLESGKLTPFPTASRRVPYHLDTKTTTVPIYCTCRLPYDKKEYVECSRCRGWYHTDCVAIPEWAIDSKRMWRCQKCKDGSALRARNLLACKT